MGKLLKLNWYALIIFLLGEIAAGVYLTINHGWISVAIFSIPCLFTLAYILDELSFKYDSCDDICSFLAILFSSVGIIIAFGFAVYLFVLIFYVDIHIITFTINIAWGFAFIFASIIWYLIVKKVNKKIRHAIKKQYKAAEMQFIRKMEAQAKAIDEQRKRDAEAQAKAIEERCKQEAERIRQKQPEYCNYCTVLINNFWNNDFFDSDEETDVLLSRLRFTLENSKYFNWKTEFYDKVVEKIKATTRPPKLPQSRQQSCATGVNLSGLNMYFNGILFTLEQYKILNNYPQVKNLYNEDLLAFCCTLAKEISEFANFQQTDLDEVKEAYSFMGLKYKDLSEESLKKAYRRLYLQYLPDWNKSANAEEIFSKLPKNYEILQKELQLKHLKIY